MNKASRALERFGLTENETKVYLEILKHTQTSPYEISRNVKIPRTTVYDIITGLALKGLIEVQQSQGFEKQQTRIKAKNPSVMRQIISSKHRELASLEVDIVDILPELKGTYLASQKDPNFQFYPGLEGLKYVFSKTFLLDVKTEIYVWDHLMPMDFIGREFMNELVDRELAIRKEKKIRPKTIIPLTEWSKHVLSYQCGRDPSYLDYHELRYIEEPFFNLHQDIYIYANHVSIMCASADEIWGLMINSKLMAETMKNIFLLSWQKAIPVTKEFMAALGENEFLAAEKSKTKS